MRRSVVVPERMVFLATWHPKHCTQHTVMQLVEKGQFETAGSVTGIGTKVLADGTWHLVCSLGCDGGARLTVKQMIQQAHGRAWTAATIAPTSQT